MRGKTCKLLRKYSSLKGNPCYDDVLKMYKSLNGPGREAFTQLAREEIEISKNEQSN
jgi:hypothetical protein